MDLAESASVARTDRSTERSGAAWARISTSYTAHWNSVVHLACGAAFDTTPGTVFAAAVGGASVAFTEVASPLMRSLVTSRP